MQRLMIGVSQSVRQAGAVRQAGSQAGSQSGRQSVSQAVSQSVSQSFQSELLLQQIKIDFI